MARIMFMLFACFGMMLAISAQEPKDYPKAVSDCYLTEDAVLISIDNCIQTDYQLTDNVLMTLEWPNNWAILNRLYTFPDGYKAMVDWDVSEYRSSPFLPEKPKDTSKLNSKRQHRNMRC